jgi:hypothetical protein
MVMHEIKFEVVDNSSLDGCDSSYQLIGPRRVKVRRNGTRRDDVTGDVTTEYSAWSPEPFIVIINTIGYGEHAGKQVKVLACRGMDVTFVESTPTKPRPIAVERAGRA